jgi:hypothetical protein
LAVLIASGWRFFWLALVIALVIGVGVIRLVASVVTALGTGTDLHIDDD